MNTQSMMNSNICIKHFPEPVIYFTDKPMCKKCIPEYMEKNKKKKAEEEGEDQQTDKLA